MTFLAHLIRPYTGLDLTKMSFLEEYHTQTTLTDTAAHAEGQFAVKKLLVEIQLGTILLTCNHEYPWMTAPQHDPAQDTR